MTTSAYIQKAIAALGGTPTSVAQVLGIKSPSVHEWMERGEVPWVRAVEIEKLTFGKIRAERLCPRYAAQITYLRGTRPIKPRRG
jgi:DNA-binding transcriptional regulator YdaS (Cro superfamily)